MDPAVDATDDTDVLRWLLEYDDEVLVQAVATAVGAKALEVMGDVYASALGTTV